MKDAFYTSQVIKRFHMTVSDYLMLSSRIFLERIFIGILGKLRYHFLYFNCRAYVEILICLESIASFMII